MRVWNINETQIHIITTDMGIITNRLDSDSVASNVTLKPIDSHAKYSRSSYSYGFNTPRRGPWLCYHGFEEFIRLAFICGATRIKSTLGDWRGLDEFEYALICWHNCYPPISTRNMGSIAFPISASDCLCDCEGGR